MVEPETYPAPLDRLDALKLDETEQPATVDYLALGIGPEHIPALIGIVTDRRYDTAMLPAGWAPLHSWRALGALGAADAAEPLTTLLDRAGDDDWILEEVPRALGLIGAPAIPSVAQYLADRERHHWGRIAAQAALRHIGGSHPDVRSAAVSVLTDQLRVFATQDTELNAFLVAGLLDLRAVESAPVIEEAFAADRVDLGITGDWEDAQVELGMLPARLTPKRRYGSFAFGPPQPEARAPRPGAARAHRAAEKRRRKIAKQSKRRNRRRK